MQRPQTRPFARTTLTTWIIVVRSRWRFNKAQWENVNVMLESELMSTYNVGLKTLSQEGLSEPAFYGNLVDKFRTLLAKLILEQF